MNIVYREADPLTDWHHWLELETALRGEAGFDDIGSRNEAAHLQKAYLDGLAVLGLDEGTGEPIGFVAAWGAPHGEYEIGSAWVHSSHRHQGWGSHLTRTLLSLPSLSHVVAFAISQTPDFWGVARKVGLRVHTNWCSPASWEATCVPCSKIPDEQKEACLLRDTTCRLFIR